MNINDMPDTVLTLTKVKGYALTTDNDENRSSIKGYFRNIHIANLKAKGAGWFGSDGSVVGVMLHTDGKQLYIVNPIGMFLDEEEQMKKDLMESITKKLSIEELEYLTKHHNLKPL